jgi:hypothetical protein
MILNPISGVAKVSLKTRGFEDDYPKQEYFRVGNFKNTKTILNLNLLYD